VSFLVDTSILARLANTADKQYPVALQSVIELHRQGETLYVTPQTIIEFRSVATRPQANNGLGLSSTESDRQTTRFESLFPLVVDTPGIFPVWKSIVSQAGTIGKQVHDARLVAVCHVHAITHLLTFNTIHFQRFASIAPGIIVVDPMTVYRDDSDFTRLSL